MKSIKVCEYSRLRSFHDDLILQDQASGERSQDQWSSGFSLPLTKVGIHFGHVRMCATPYPISLIIFILDLGPSYTDKLLECRWVQIAHLS